VNTRTIKITQKGHAVLYLTERAAFDRRTKKVWMFCVRGILII
jgi:hypothetical protein